MKKRRKEVEDAKGARGSKRKKLKAKNDKAEGYSSVAEWLEAKEAERAAYEIKKGRREEGGY